jgi:hypothetical protein
MESRKSIYTIAREMKDFVACGAARMVLYVPDDGRPVAITETNDGKYEIAYIEGQQYGIIFTEKPSISISVDEVSAEITAIEEAVKLAQMVA